MPLYSINHKLDKNKLSRAIYKCDESDDHEQLNVNAQNFIMQYILAIKMNFFNNLDLEFIFFL